MRRRLRCFPPLPARSPAAIVVGAMTAGFSRRFGRCDRADQPDGTAYFAWQFGKLRQKPHAGRGRRDDHVPHDQLQ
ncbi:hypothetical protein B1T52_03730 [Mycobacterium kansasii]|nr:hypothetical protein B1T52_03730 [Mycobacterium kansasii]